MAIFNKPPHYRSFLLTLWEERSQDPQRPTVWRFSLEDSRTGQRRGFAGLEALLAALQEIIKDTEAEETDHRSTSSARGPPFSVDIS